MRARAVTGRQDPAGLGQQKGAYRGGGEAAESGGRWGEVVELPAAVAAGTSCGQRVASMRWGCREGFGRRLYGAGVLRVLRLGLRVYGVGFGVWAVPGREEGREGGREGG